MPRESGIVTVAIPTITPTAHWLLSNLRPSVLKRIKTTVRAYLRTLEKIGDAAEDINYMGRYSFRPVISLPWPSIRLESTSWAPWL